MVAEDRLPSRSPPADAAPVPVWFWAWFWVWFWAWLWVMPGGVPIRIPPGPAAPPGPPPLPGPALGIEPVCAVPAVVREYAAGAASPATRAAEATTSATLRGRCRTPTSSSAALSPTTATTHLSQGR